VRVLSVVENHLGSAYYRQLVPFGALRAAGYDVGLVDTPIVPGGVLAHYDVIQTLRIASHDATPALTQITALQRSGKRFVIDYDDDLINIPPHNPARLGVTPSEVIRAVQTVDAITVTSDALAAVYRPYARRIGIIPNYVDVAHWPARQPRAGLTIGLVGSASHHEDWKLIATPMRRIRARFPEVKFLVAGYLPDYLEDLATEYVDWQPIADYQQTVNRIDIGLCPLLADDFNKRKTPIKAMEYGMAQAAVVASPTLYRDLVGGKGTIARSESDWEAAIAAYIQDADLRGRHARALHHHVITRCDVARHASAIDTTYRKLFTGATEAPTGDHSHHGRRNHDQRAAHTGRAG
jgi:glycosyltransferase involved in cell wall biosynthesis